MRCEAEVEDVLDAVPRGVLETLPPGHEVFIIQTLVTILGDVELTSVSKQSILMSLSLKLTQFTWLYD